MSMFLKQNDTVQILSGRDKGKQGKITQVFPEKALIVVDGVNIRFKHLRARRRGDSGQRVQFAAPLAVAKVQLICPHCSKKTRVGYDITGDKKLRMCKKCKQTI